MKRLKLWIRFIVKFVRYDIWRITSNELTRTKQILINIIKIIYLSIKGIGTHRLNIHSSALSFTVTFALVPLIALIIAIARGFGIENMIEETLSSTMFGQSNLVPYIMDFVTKYLDYLRGGLFIGVGLGILVYSVYNLFAQIERALNSIWQVNKSRSILRQFTIYFSGLLIFPILIAVSSGLSIYINNILKNALFFHLFNPFVQIVLSALPYIVSVLLFTLMFLIIPNTKVKFANAFIAGIITGISFQIFQTIYVNGQINLTRYNAVYGGFAALPLLLLWLKISSLIFLIGAEISYVSQNIRHFDYLVDTENISIRYKKNISLFISYIIIKRFEAGLPAYSTEDITSKYKLPIRLVNQILQELTQANIVVRSEGEKAVVSYLPAKDINQITLKDIESKLETQGAELFLQNKNAEMDLFWKNVMEIQYSCDEIKSKTLLKDL